MQRIAVADRRAALFAATVRVIARDGVVGATTRAIVGEAEMPLASFHYAFRSREAMLGELVTALLDEQRIEIEDAVARATTLADCTAGALDAYFERVRRNPEVEQVLLDLVTWSRTVPQLVALPAVIYDRYQATTEALVELVSARFGCTWPSPVPEIARFMLAAVDGATARWLVDRDDEAARRTLRTAAIVVVGLAVVPG